MWVWNLMNQHFQSKPLIRRLLLSIIRLQHPLLFFVKWVSDSLWAESLVTDQLIRAPPAQLQTDCLYDTHNLKYCYSNVILTWHWLSCIESQNICSNFSPFMTSFHWDIWTFSAPKVGLQQEFCIFTSNPADDHRHVTWTHSSQFSQIHTNESFLSHQY